MRIVKLWIAPLEIDRILVDGIVREADTRLVSGSGIRVIKGGHAAARHTFLTARISNQESTPEECLRQVIRECLTEANTRGLRSLVFPCMAIDGHSGDPAASCLVMGKAIAGFDFSGSALETIGFAIPESKVLQVFIDRFPELISMNTNLDFTDDWPLVLGNRR